MPSSRVGSRKGIRGSPACRGHSSSRGRSCRGGCRYRWGIGSSMRLCEPAIGRVVPVAGSLLLVWAAAVAAQDSTFIRATTDPTNRIPAFIGNGALSLVSAPLGTTPAPSFAAGVYDHAPDDVPRIVILPAWNAI